MPILLRDRAVLVPPIPLVTAAEGRMLGLALRPPRFHRVRPGVWAERDAWDALPSWRRYQARVHALLRVDPDAVLCLESAAVVQTSCASSPWCRDSSSRIP